MQPVTGPFVTDKQELGPSNSLGQRTIWYTDHKVSSRQKRPYNLPLPYNRVLKRITSFTHTNDDALLSLSQCTCMTNWWDPNGSVSAVSFNKAYRQCMAQLKPAQAELGAAAGEWHQSFGMITKRAGQLVKAYTAIRRGRFADAAKVLGLKGSPKGVSRKKQFADNLLEYRFGWGPLIGDISAAVETLASGLPAFRVSGSGSVRGSKATDSGPGGDTRSTSDSSYISSHKIRFWVRGYNPNTAVANQLGIVNLASVVWELVPYSFVVDYFTNVGQFLAGFTDQIGFDLADVNWTWRTMTTSTNTVSWDLKTDHPGHAEWTAYKFELERAVGPLPGPILTSQFKNIFAPTYDKQGNLNTPWRAATSIALLLQKLR